MIHRKRIISLVLTAVMCLGLGLQVNASEISETKEKAAQLENQKKAAENEKNSLAAQLEKIAGEMEDLQGQIEEKEMELFAKEEELSQAKVEENEQYQDMKKRIKYMYENGNAQFIEILLESKTIGDFLNKAEYISTISEYDRDMLEQFQEIVKAVEKQEAEIRDEYEEMGDMQDELIAKQDQVSKLVTQKEAEISSLGSQLDDTNKKLAQLEEAAAEAQRKQAEAAASQQAQSSAGSGYKPGGAGAAVVSGNGTFTHPCPGYTYISSYFGYREQPLAGASTNHKGMDFAAPQGTPIYAAASGTVVSAAYSGNAGNMITISHGNGLSTIYMHCYQMYVSAGQTVSKGQNIASVGTTGNSTGPHLHFQVNLNGVPTNPMNYL
ncbi:peptidoglycan DD-metalloendopeptidase family protein [uncultured Merdimonas sp.]|uniref:murein hydrolase activator EnvC family protein n=1 Tax=uncultured Merdimonas sp. TaxID=2023269 RepID=UPI003208038C